MALCSLEEKEESNVDQDSSERSASGDESSEDQPGGNAGWADSIAKVLCTTKPKNKKVLVLSRAKKIKNDFKNKTEGPSYDFEVEGEVKEEKQSEIELEPISKQVKNQKLSLRAKPSWKDMDRERTLRKVATRGVVQLFNAVRTQQKDLQHQLEDAGPLDSRKEAVLNNINKRKFLDVLMSGKRSKSEQLDNPVKNEFLREESESSEDDANNTHKKSEWSVLRDDFMTNKKIKHWDEEPTDEEESNEDD